MVKLVMMMEREKRRASCAENFITCLLAYLGYRASKIRWPTYSINFETGPSKGVASS
jgi:hypothetical protein